MSQQVGRNVGHNSKSLHHTSISRERCRLQIYLIPFSDGMPEQLSGKGENMSILM